MSGIRPQRLTEAVNRQIEGAAAAANKTSERRASSSSLSSRSNRIRIHSLSPYLQPHEHSDLEHRQLLQAIREDAASTGFFLIRDHGVDLDLIHRAHELAARFFDETPKPIKDEMRQSQNLQEGERVTLRGYTTDESIDNYYGREAVEFDPVEKLTIGKEDNMWPPTRNDCVAATGMEKFQVTLEEYYESLDKLARRLIQMFEDLLNVERDTIPKLLGRGTANAFLRLLYYPKQPVENRELMGGHTDVGTITIVSASSAGYEIMIDEEWELIPYVSTDVFIVNLGDLFRVWTNDQWKSSLHRVRAVSVDKSRLSLAFFANQDVEQDEPGTEPHLIQTLPSFRGEGIDYGSVNFKAQCLAGVKRIRGLSV